MTLTNIVGYAAATVGTLLMLPQIIKMVRTKSVNDVSSWMIAVYLLNCVLWEAYGVLLGSWPMIICNAIGIIIGFTQGIVQWKYHK